MPRHKALPSQGKNAFMIRQYVNAFQCMDMDTKSGSVFAYVYPTDNSTAAAAERVANQAYLSLLSKNGLDPTVFPSTMKLENEVVSMVATHLRATNEVVGNFTSGGTESCFLAVKTAREWARATKGIAHPNLVIPDSAHPAFHKAAQILDMKVIIVPCSSTSWRADLKATEAAMTKDTALLVGSACSYPHGVVDPIGELGRLAARKQVLLHVDGCIGAFVLPFFERIRKTAERDPNDRADPEAFDFSVPGVTSISVDLHKYAFCPKGASIVLYRDKALRSHQLFAYSAWAGYTMINTTLQSSKTGGPIAAAWATMNFLGDEGYYKQMLQTYKGTMALANGIRETDGVELMAEPESCLIAFKSTDPKLNVFQLAEEMKQKGWFIQPQLPYRASQPNIHLSCNPQSQHRAPALLADLRACIAACRAAPADFGTLEARIHAQLAELPGGGEAPGLLLARDQYERILDLVGLSATELPERMDGINAVLSTIPHNLRIQVLKTFINDLFVHDEDQAEVEGRKFAALKLAQIKAAALRWATFATVAAVGVALVMSARRK